MRKNQPKPLFLVCNERQPAAVPRIFSLQRRDDIAEFRRLVKREHLVVRDEFKDQLWELFLVRHPKLKLNPRKAHVDASAFVAAEEKRMPLWMQGRWVYFPWKKHLAHVLAPAEFDEARFSRNRNLITQREQAILQRARVGIAGLSVGSHVALCLALSGTGAMRLADHDKLSLSNLNRIRAGIPELGANKAVIAAEQIYEIHPYAKIALFPHGINKKNLKSFLAGPPKLTVAVDEMDDVAMKIELRLLARQFRIPVVSAADNGDNAIVDIERFDREPKRPIFHGRVDEETAQETHDVSFEEHLKRISAMVGMEYVTPRMNESLSQVGKALYTWPQLAGAAMLSGAAAAYAVRKIILGDPLRSGKYNVNMERVFSR